MPYKDPEARRARERARYRERMQDPAFVEARRAKERARSRPARPNRKRSPQPSRPRIEEWKIRSYIAWKSESIQVEELPDGSRRHKIVCLGNSRGDILYDRRGLSFKRIMRWLLFELEFPKRVQHVGFAFAIDTNLIIADIPEYTRRPYRDYQAHGWRRLALPGEGYTRYGEYSVNYKAGRMTTFGHFTSGKRLSIYDLAPFANVPLVEACANARLSVPSVVRAHKRAGGENRKRHTKDEITAYVATEARLVAQLATTYREGCIRAGLPFSVPNSRGRLARHILDQSTLRDGLIREEHYRDDMYAAVMTANYGGRNDVAYVGPFATSYLADIRSAHAWATAQVPAPWYLRWPHRSTRRFNIATIPDVALVRVRWSVDPLHPWMPFPWRRNGYTFYPPAAEGWYYACEVRAALRRFPSGIEPFEAWIPRGEITTPLREVVDAAYARRRELRDAGDVVGSDMLKFGLAAMWGKFGERMGDRAEDVPVYRSFLLAGFVNALVRARLSEAIGSFKSPHDVLAVTTDSILSRKPLPQSDAVRIGPELGAWKTFPTVANLAIIGPARYIALDEDGGIINETQMGVDGKAIDHYGILSRFGLLPYEWEHRNANVFRRPRFIGIKMAMMSKTYRARRNCWMDMIHEMASPLAPSGARIGLVGNYHSKRGDDLIGGTSGVIGPRFLEPRGIDPDWNSLATPYVPSRVLWDGGQRFLDKDDDTLAEEEDDAIGECATA